jgi:hypothetical protein
MTDNQSRITSVSVLSDSLSPEEVGHRCKTAATLQREGKSAEAYESHLQPLFDALREDEDAPG